MKDIIQIAIIIFLGFYLIWVYNKIKEFDELLDAERKRRRKEHEDYLIKKSDKAIEKLKKRE